MKSLFRKVGLTSLLAQAVSSLAQAAYWIDRLWQQLHGHGALFALQGGRT